MTGPSPRALIHKLGEVESEVHGWLIKNDFKCEFSRYFSSSDWPTSVNTANLPGASLFWEKHCKSVQFSPAITELLGSP